MQKDPAFLFYSSDFLTGTALLTHEEVGKYIRLLCHMHQHGELRKDQMELLVGNLSVNLLDKFRLTENNTYVNDRLFEEMSKRKKFTESRRENGKKGGRKPNGLPIDKPNGYASENLPENENDNENTNVIKGGTGGKADHKVLSEMEANQAFEFLSRIGRKDLTKEDILNYWQAFILHKQDFHIESRGRQMQHFRDWLKFQKKENVKNGTHQQSFSTTKRSQNSESISELLTSIDDDIQRIRSENNRA